MLNLKYFCCAYFSTSLALVFPALSNPAMAAVTTGTPTSSSTATTPDRTVSSFGDWNMTCTQLTVGGRVCEVGTSAQDQSHQLAMSVGIGRIAKDQPLAIVVQVPVNVRVSQSLHLVLDDAAPVALTFLNCNRLGCFARLEMKDDSIIKRLRAHGLDTPARAEWMDSSGNNVSLAFSTKGTGAALDALNDATK